ncbi:unnamed protein product [Cunninghamella echinulata]
MGNTSSKKKKNRPNNEYSVNTATSINSILVNSSLQRQSANLSDSNTQSTFPNQLPAQTNNNNNTTTTNNNNDNNSKNNEASQRKKRDSGDMWPQQQQLATSVEDEI